MKSWIVWKNSAGCVMQPATEIKDFFGHNAAEGLRVLTIGLTDFAEGDTLEFVEAEAQPTEGNPEGNP